MNKKALLSLILAGMFLANLSSVALAAGHKTAPNPRAGRHEAKKPLPKAPPPHQHRVSHYEPPLPPHAYNRYKFANFWQGRHGYIRPGYTMPDYYHSQRHYYAVNDWRMHGLYAPPHGHHWLMIDGNFILASIATGIVAHILFCH
jgi:Ni/Co efflux regulator RcnB